MHVPRAAIPSRGPRSGRRPHGADAAESRGVGLADLTAGSEARQRAGTGQGAHDEPRHHSGEDGTGRDPGDRVDRRKGCRHRSRYIVKPADPQRLHLRTAYTAAIAARLHRHRQLIRPSESGNKKRYEDWYQALDPFHDIAGRKATKALQTILSDKYEVVDDPPQYGKDVNDFLCKRLGIKDKTERSFAR